MSELKCSGHPPVLNQYAPVRAECPIPLSPPPPPAAQMGRSPVELRVGMGAGVFVGCGAGIGIITPVSLHTIPVLGQLASSLASSLGSLNAATGGLATAARGRVQGLGVRGLDMGFGCGVMLGYGWGAGLMLSPTAQHSVAGGLHSAGQRLLAALPQQLQAALQPPQKRREVAAAGAPGADLYSSSGVAGSLQDSTAPKQSGILPAGEPRGPTSCLPCWPASPHNCNAARAPSQMPCFCCRRWTCHRSRGVGAGGRQQRAAYVPGSSAPAATPAAAAPACPGRRSRRGTAGPAGGAPTERAGRAAAAGGGPAGGAVQPGSLLASVQARQLTAAHAMHDCLTDCSCHGGSKAHLSRAPLTQRRQPRCGWVAAAGPASRKLGGIRLGGGSRSQESNVEAIGSRVSMKQVDAKERAFKA